MFLLKINKQNKIAFQVIKKILFNIKVLTILKHPQKIKKLKLILMFLVLKKNKSLYVKNRSKFYQTLPICSSNNVFSKQHVHYIVNINLTYTNTFINVTDIKGNVKINYSGGSVGLKSKQKIKQPTAMLSLIKHLIINAKFLNNNSLALHFKNTRLNYERYVIKLLKQFFFIKTVKSYNFQPHNGCRPKKIKRLKKNFIKFVLKR